MTTAAATATTSTVSSTPNLSAPPHYLSNFFGAARTAGTEMANSKFFLGRC
jgi:hypothetical protein